MLGRLCFDVRGELNLRRPESSFIALVKDRPEHDYNPDGAEQPESSALLKTSSGGKCKLYINSPGHFQVIASHVMLRLRLITRVSHSAREYAFDNITLRVHSFNGGQVPQ